MKKRQIVLTLVIVTSSLLMACGSKKEESVSAMNNVPIETEVSSSEETTDIAETESITETENETETESITESETETESITESETITITETNEIPSFTITAIDTTMYALSDSYTYEGPSTSDYAQKATVVEEEQVRVIGKVNEAEWYKIEQEGGIESFISAEFLTEEAPVVEESVVVQSSQPAQNQNQASQQTTQTPQPEIETPQQTTSEPSTPKREVAGEVSVASEAGGRLINPDTGEYYKKGDTFSDGSVYGGFHKSSDYGFFR